MRQVFGSFARGVLVVVVAVSLSVPAVYAAPREKGGDTIVERVVRTVRRAISIVFGDEMTEPKPAPPSTTTT
jgi:hypothetical protein